MAILSNFQTFFYSLNARFQPRRRMIALAAVGCKSLFK
jgi:hypothetical protein